MTRTDAIKKAIDLLLESRRVELDASEDIAGLTLDLSFTSGVWKPWRVVDNIRRERFEDSNKGLERRAERRT